MIGFDDVHTRAHVYRAILEGLAYALRQDRERIERRSGTPIVRLRVAGGGSQSDAAMQPTANIFGLPAECPHVYRAPGLSATIDCVVGLGLYPDVASTVAGVTRVGRVFLPQVEARQIYQRLYGEVYLRMYRQLHSFYRSIREITGYPA